MDIIAALKDVLVRYKWVWLSLGIFGILLLWILVWMICSPANTPFHYTNF